MLFSIFRLFLAYSAPRFQKNRVPVSVLNVKAGINELTQHRPALDDLNKAQLGRLLEHCKIADVKPYVDHYNLTGVHLARGIVDEGSLTDLSMTPIQARSLLSFISEWKNVGLPRDFTANGAENALKPPQLSNETRRHQQLLEDAFTTARMPRNATPEAQASLSHLMKEESRGSPLAAAHLSFLFHEGCPVLAKNKTEARRLVNKCLPWLQSASVQGDPFAQCMLGEFYRLGNGVPQSYEESAIYAQLAAGQGHAEGQVMLARAHLSGRGVLQNDTRAFELYVLAAEQGHVEGSYRAGLCILEGWGFTRPMQVWEPPNHFDTHWQYFRDHYSLSEDLEEQKKRDCNSSIWIDHLKYQVRALPYFRTAADKGHREAAFLAAEYYQIYNDENDNEEVLEDESLKYFKIAADLGHAESQLRLGRKYLFLNTTTALHYFELAAAQGNHDSAANHCAQLYLTPGDHYDLTKGLHYLHLAAERNVPFYYAVQLAKLYDTGDGVEKNLGVAAHYYYRGLTRFNFGEQDLQDKERLVRLEAEGYSGPIYAYDW